jgi:1,4-alpha-glucan branching enzyme
MDNISLNRVKAPPPKAPPIAKPAPSSPPPPAPAKAVAPVSPQAAPKAPASGPPVTKFELYERNAKAVFVAGSFNAWNPTATPLKNNGSGKWETSLQLSPGKYQYRFVVDGKWIADPLAKETVPNPFEGVNSVLSVK